MSKKVGENEVISAINLTSEAAKIIASRIQLEGLVTANNNFKVLLDGSIEAVNGKFSGTITADSGTIGGASIDSQGVFFNSGNNGWGLWGTTSHDNIVFHAGSTTSSIGTAPFRVKADGSMYATAGKIADFTISGAQLIGNNVGLSGTAGQGYAFWSGSNTAGSAPFRVGHDGSLVATSATITGNISSSNISGSNITGGSIRIESTGFFAFGTGTTHPWASAINVTGLYGVNFYSGTSASNTGTQQGYIDMGGSNGALEVISPYTDVVIGGYHVKLSAREGYVYASRNGSTNYLVSTESGNISSLNLKENIKIFDDDEYNRAYQLLQKIDFYRYDYKYKISENKKEYGFIIDYIEKNNGYDDFLYFYKQQANVENNELDYLVEDTDENVIEFKKYNEENLLKYVFTLLKCMQKKIDKLESEKNHE